MTAIQQNFLLSSSFTTAGLQIQKTYIFNSKVLHCVRHSNVRQMWSLWACHFLSLRYGENTMMYVALSRNTLYGLSKFNNREMPKLSACMLCYIRVNWHRQRERESERGKPKVDVWLWWLPSVKCEKKSNRRDGIEMTKPAKSQGLSGPWF